MGKVTKVMGQTLFFPDLVKPYSGRAFANCCNIATLNAPDARRVPIPDWGFRPKLDGSRQVEISEKLSAQGYKYLDRVGGAAASILGRTQGTVVS